MSAIEPVATKPNGVSLRIKAKIYARKIAPKVIQNGLLKNWLIIQTE